MDAVASCGVTTTCRPPPSSISGHLRGRQLSLNIIIPCPSRPLILRQSKLSAFPRHIMAGKRSPNISFTVLRDGKNNPSGKCSIMSEHKQVAFKREPNESQKNDTHVSTGEFMLKLRKPGDKKPEVRTPNLISRVETEGSSDEIMGIRGYKAQKSEYEMYMSRPVQVVLLNKPMAMEAKPQKGISLRGPDALCEEKKNEPITQNVINPINPENTQEIRPIMNKLPEKVHIDLRKPSMPSRQPNPNALLDKETNLKLKSKLNQYEPEVQQGINPESKQKARLMNKFMELADNDLKRLSMPSSDYMKIAPKHQMQSRPLLDRETDLKPGPQLESSPLLDKKMYNRGVSRHGVFEGNNQISVNIRKPIMSPNPNDKIKTDPEIISESDQLIEWEKYGTGDVSNIMFEEDRKKMDFNLRKSDRPSNVDLKHEVATNLLMAMRKYDGGALYDVTVHEQTEFDVGVNGIRKSNDQVVASARNMQQNSVRLNLPSAGTNVSSENKEWKRMEQLCATGDRFLAELTSYNHGGFYATYGSLVGFIPYRNVGTRYRFYALESWLRKKSFDPAMYGHKLNTTGLTDKKNVKENLVLGTVNLNDNQTAEEPLPSNSNFNFEDLLHEYEQEKDQFLSSFVGQPLRVSVMTADQNSKRLIFTAKPRGNKDILDKKRAVMAKLKVGDIVKCQIERFAYFGIFVQVEGVTALIPQPELMFDDTLDLLFSLTVGKIVDARVHALNFTLGRIVLSLKGTKIESLKGDFESVVNGGKDTSLGGSLEEVETYEEWKDVELLINELEKIEEVNSICKGSFYLSSGLAPTFQVYMAPMVDDKYRLLARSENKVQEVLVKASMNIEEMKSAILACTSRVA